MGEKKDMTKKRIRTIYSIICPITNNVIYIGITNNFKSRANAHVTAAKKGSKALIYFYIRYILNAKQKPIFKPIRKVFLSYTESEFIEAEEIEKYKKTCMNEMYGNGERIKDNITLKNKFINNELDYIKYFEKNNQNVNTHTV